MQYEGIPPHVTLDYAKEWVRPRVSDKRFKHIKGVVSAANRICAACNSDAFLAALGAWLHDACKEVKDKELVRMAREFDLPLDPILETYGHLLHGPVAAELVKRELSIGNAEIYAAISQHTLGAAPMSTLSKIVFLADCLEASRPEGYTKPIWAALDINGRINLDAALVVACDEGLKHLIADRKPIHPTTIAVRNFYLSRRQFSMDV
jgi:predicted HD superfamily hydrolase involved in NAD metabolism